MVRLLPRPEPEASFSLLLRSHGQTYQPFLLYSPGLKMTSNIIKRDNMILSKVNGLNPGVSVVRVVWSSRWVYQQQSPTTVTKSPTSQQVTVNKSPTTVLFRTTLTRTITLHELMILSLDEFWHLSLVYVHNGSCVTAPLPMAGQQVRFTVVGMEKWTLLL